MVKAGVNTPNKRKSFTPKSSAKKLKVENGNGTASPVKAVTPKKQAQSPKGKLQSNQNDKNIKVESNDKLPKITPKGKQLNKSNQNTPQVAKGKPQKNKQVKAEASEAPEPVVAAPNASQKIQQKTEEAPENVKATTAKPKGPKPKAQAKTAKDGVQTAESNKKRKNAFSNLAAEVKAKEGSKDAELNKVLDTRIAAITIRKELTKTAKKKLGILNKLKMIINEGSTAASAKTKAEIAEAKNAAAEKKLQKKAQPEKKAAVGNKGKAPSKQVPEDDDDDEDGDEEKSGGEEAASDEESDDSDS